MIKLKNKLSSTALILIATSVMMLIGCETTTTGNLGEKDPEAARDAYVQLGVEYLKLDDRENAKARFLKALSVDPDSAAAYTGLALIYERSQEYDAAEDFFRKALRSDDDFTQAKTQYGLFLLNQSRYKEACRILKDATSDVLSSQRYISMYYLGKCQIARAAYADAVDTLALATRVNQRFAPSWSELALAQYHMGELDAAKQSLNEFRRYSSESPMTLLLTLKIAMAEGDEAGLNYAARELQIKYPNSEEWLEYEQMNSL